MNNNRAPRKKVQKGVLGRTIKALFKAYPKMMTLTLIFIVVNAVISSIPSIFMEKIFSVVGYALKESADWTKYGGEIIKDMLILIGLYVISLVMGAVDKQMMAIITQGFLKKMRCQMFDGMQNLPIKYFDTNSHGDIMSYYTNDIDALRQMISQSLPQLLTSGIMVLTLFIIMIWYSLWLTAIVLVGVIFITIVTKIVGGGAGKYFRGQQRAVGKTEGFIEEMMNGQKVVKVFCHENAAKADFDKVNEYLFDQSNRANRYANMLMPILGNIGHLMYVIVALVGGAFILGSVSNVSLGLAFAPDLAVISVALVVAFLQMTRQFCNNINQVSNQLNSVVMGIAGAARLFSLIDQKPEVDDGYVTLVNAKEENGVITECEERTGLWAWKHPHGDGTVTYTKLCGDVVLSEVDFEYEQGNPVLQARTKGRLCRRDGRG